MSEAITGQGTVFQREDTPASDTYTALANVYNISGPGMSRDTIEITTYDSQGWREKMGGLRDGGTITFTLNFTRAGYLIVKGDFETDTPVNYQVVLPDDDNTTLTLAGLVTELPLSIPEGDRITCDVTIEISGQVTDDAI